MKLLNKKQTDLLARYYIHRLGIEHFGSEKEKKYVSADWESDMHAAEIPLATRRAVERMAADKAFFTLYFSTVLSREGLLNVSE